MNFMYNGFARCIKTSPFDPETGTVFMHATRNTDLYIMDAPLTFKTPNHELPHTDDYVFLCCALKIEVDKQSGWPTASNVGLVPLDQFVCDKDELVKNMLMDKCNSALSKLANHSVIGQSSSSSTQHVPWLTLMD